MILFADSKDLDQTAHLAIALILFADSKDPDQTAQLRSLIWIFAVGTWPKGTFSLGGAWFRLMDTLSGEVTLSEMFFCKKYNFFL